ncbi:MAG: ATP-binding cassette domain-containing protein [Tenericutes bacterium]|jgi:ATPase subunit of ABC transporter with duplicated ATPase domains|nr:ATP-binding cassette domain-containing protein [Mycoplasmatota bacterium]
MITVSNLSLIFSDKKIFEDVNLKFLLGNCYGLIGANGAGKTTFLKLLSGEKEQTSGDIIIEKNKRLAFLSQNQNAFDQYTVLETVFMGHKRLFEIMQAKEHIYQKEVITDEEGYALSNLEAEFMELDGWDAEPDAEKLLNGLNVPEEDFNKKMSDVLPKNKVKVLLAQALFGNPDILLLDEPTNNLDFEAIAWLENFLVNYDHTVITVSHDRHFLNNVCTHMVDIDYYQAKLYAGNYDFWMESSQLIQKLMADKNKKKEERMQELKTFIARFSANLSKSSQATSRKKSLEKIQLDEIIPSTRKYPFIGFEIEKQLGKDVLEVKDLSFSLDGMKLFENVSFIMNRGDKVALLGNNDLAKTALLKILAGELKPETGTIKWGQTVSMSYFPSDNDTYFVGKDQNLIDWLRQYSKEPAESYIRGFLGRMLFSGDQPLKQVKYLSGGEKMRCMYSKLMLSHANTLLIDSPTIHLDLEAIQSVNRGLEDYKGALIVASHDHDLLESVCNKIVEIGDLGAYSYEGSFDHYISDTDIKEKRKQLYKKII